MPEHADDVLKPGQHFDPGPFALDLYRLLCIVLADKAVAKLSVDARVLVSSAVALRIMFDRYPKAFGKLPQRPCGILYPKWPGRTSELLPLREACNKIVNATDSKDDLARNPNEEGSYVRPFLYLYGTKENDGWRVQLSIVEFVRGAASAFARASR